jgi:anti-sigma factor RsiW
MCPDRDLVSAYVDGEVPSPWRERLEEHLAACPDCAAIASGYARLGARLKAELASDEVARDEAGCLERGRLRLDALLQGLPGAVRADRSPPWKDWRRSVSLPLPIAAAAALLVLLLGGATTLLALRPSRGAQIQSVASGEITPQPLEASAQPASMDELLRYLDARDGQVTLTIKLPSGTTFGSAGKPVIMRGSTVGGRAP